jgi:hypothetical protein
MPETLQDNNQNEIEHSKEPTDRLVGAAALRNVSAEATPAHHKEKDVTAEEATFLRDLYSLNDVLSLKSTEGAHRLNARVIKLTESENFRKIVMDTDLPQSPPLDGEKSSRNWTREQQRDYADRFLGTIAELPKDISDDLLRAAYERLLESDADDNLLDEENPKIDYKKLRGLLIRTAINVKEVDDEALRDAHDKVGLVNLDHYNAEQISRMAKFANGDPATLEELRKGDVTVVFVDATADHNGAFEDVPKIYEGANGRTLYFEIRKRSDFNRARVLLDRFQIKASTIVVAAHGLPGRSYYGTGDDAFLLSARAKQARKQNLSLAHMDFLPEVLDGMMQDSQGIDDHPDAKGRRRIILHSCNGAVARRYARILPDGSKEPYEESTGGALVKLINNPKMDVFAAAGKLIAEKTESGLDMKIKDTESGTSEVFAIKLTVDANGDTYQERIPTIHLFPEKPKLSPDDPNYWGSW